MHLSRYFVAAILAALIVAGFTGEDAQAEELLASWYGPGFEGIAADTPIYQQGETVIFEVELEHNIHLGDAWATFFLREEGERTERVALQLDAQKIQQIARVGDKLTSAITFEGELSEYRSPPGIYDLGNILGLPSESSRSLAKQGTVLDAPPYVSFRVIEVPREPVSRTTSWEFDHRLRSWTPQYRYN